MEERSKYSAKKTFVFAMSRKQTPSDFLKLIIGRPVVVKLNNGMDYRGKKKKKLRMILKEILKLCLVFLSTLTGASVP